MHPLCTIFLRKFKNWHNFITILAFISTPTHMEKTWKQPNPQLVFYSASAWEFKLSLTKPQVIEVLITRLEEREIERIEGRYSLNPRHWEWRRSNYTSLEYSLCWKDLHLLSRNTQFFCFVHGSRRRQQGQCKQMHTDLTTIETSQTTTTRRKRNFSSMDFSWCLSSPIISTLVHFLLVVSLVCPVCSSSSEIGNDPVANQTLRPQEELQKLNIIRIHLQQINKPAVKTIQVCQSFKLFPFPLFFCSVFWTITLWVFDFLFFHFCEESGWWYNRLCCNSSATSFRSSSIERTEATGNYFDCVKTLLEFYYLKLRHFKWSNGKFFMHV